MLPTPDLPAEPERAAGERETLRGFLDYQRGVVVSKVGGLSEAQLRETMTPTGLSLLGVMNHLAVVERWWFRILFAGEDIAPGWSDEDPDADWHIPPDTSSADVRALYEEEISEARRIAEAADLDAVAQDPRAEGVTMRWILVHMIEETARHLGHADLMRERLDGGTGD